MERLSMCRVCLAEDGLRVIVDTHLQEIYECLVILPLETKDNRPIQVCYICCARLQNCYELKRSCLQSEELFTNMLSSDVHELQPVKLQQSANKKRLTIEHPLVVLNVGDMSQINNDSDCKEANKMLIEVKVSHEDIDDNNVDVKVFHEMVDFRVNHEDVNVTGNQENVDATVNHELVVTVNYEKVDVVENHEDIEGEDDNALDEEKLNDTVESVNSDDDCIIIKESNLPGEEPSVDMPMKLKPTAPKTSDDSTSSKFVENATLEIEVEFEDLKGKKFTDSSSSSLCSEDEIDVTSFGTQRSETQQNYLPLDSVNSSVLERSKQTDEEDTDVRKSARIKARKHRISTPPETEAPSIVRRRKSRRKSLVETLSDSDTGSPRIARNDKEKCRRRGLKTLFDNLKQEIPAIKHCDRTSSVLILDQATAFCKQLTEEDIEREKLRKKQRRLAAKLESLLKKW